MFNATADAQGFAGVLDTSRTRATMTPEDQDLDDVQNKAMYTVFQSTLQTPETQAIVLDLETAQEKSRKAWDGINKHFQGSIYHLNTKSNMLTDISNFRWPVAKWTDTYTSFVLELEKLIINYDQVADTNERFDDRRKKEALKQAILGCPDLMSLEMFENDHIKNHGRPMDYKEYRNMVVNMCGSLDIARDASNPFSYPEIPEDDDVLHDTNPVSTVTYSINRIERGSTKLSDKRYELLKPMFLNASKETVEHTFNATTSTYGSEFVAARTATDQIIDLRLTLRYLGIPIYRSVMFGDSDSKFLEVIKFCGGSVGSS